MLKIFSESAQANITKTGNVWGHDISYAFNFSVNLPFGYSARLQQRAKGNLGGRFGGGWNFHLGIQGGGSTWIIFLGVMSVRIGKRK